MDGMYFMNERGDWIHLRFCTAADVNRSRETALGSAAGGTQPNHFDVLSLIGGAKEPSRVILRGA